MIQRYQEAGFVDPETALRDIWESLQDRFATPARVASALLEKLQNIPPIKTRSSVSKLEEILDLGKIILSNVCSHSSLRIFNLEEGMKRYWEKLPEIGRAHV